MSYKSPNKKREYDKPGPTYVRDVPAYNKTYKKQYSPPSAKYYNKTYKHKSNVSDQRNPMHEQRNAPVPVPAPVPQPVFKNYRGAPPPRYIKPKYNPLQIKPKYRKDNIAMNMNVKEVPSSPPSPKSSSLKKEIIKAQQYEPPPVAASNDKSSLLKQLNTKTPTPSLMPASSLIEKVPPPPPPPPIPKDSKQKITKEKTPLKEFTPEQQQQLKEKIEDAKIIINSFKKIKKKNKTDQKMVDIIKKKILANKKAKEELFTLGKEIKHDTNENLLDDIANISFGKNLGALQSSFNAIFLPKNIIEYVIILYSAISYKLKIGKEKDAAMSDNEEVKKLKEFFYQNKTTELFKSIDEAIDGLIQVTNNSYLIKFKTMFNIVASAASLIDYVPALYNLRSYVPFLRTNNTAK